MIIRVQSSVGTKKLELTESDTFGEFLKHVSNSFGIVNDNSWFLSKTRKETGKLTSSARSQLSKLGLKHGDMIFLVERNGGSNIVLSPGDIALGDDTDTSRMGKNGLHTDVPEDEVDREMAKMDGRIKRKRNEQLCHHPSSGKCIHCVPLEPFDSDYLGHLDPPVKFMSFHAYLRKLSGGQSKGKFITLENLRCHVRPGCHEHPPWPDGICTKCQPNPVTLDIQPYRHVDYVQFENAQLIEQFLNYWRKTGNQRIGLMLGRYAHFNTKGSPPLAIKAVVATIYEPLQESTNKTVKLTAPLDALLPPHVAEVAKRLNLRPVGWIFTDLVAETRPNRGQVKHHRGTVDTYFLSAEECVTAAHLQNLHPNICSYSKDRCFGSKFVTVVVTGDKTNNINFEAYQVSNQAMALERDNILVPTYDAPEFGYIRETTKEQFVPEVFYTLTDKYANRVTRIARPLPVEYLLVDMPTAFPREPVYTFAQFPSTLVDANARFPIENREVLGQTQEVSVFARFLTTLGDHSLYSYLSNFHVLAWLAGQDSLPLKLTPDSESDPQGLTGLLNALVRPSATSCSSAERLSELETNVARWAAESSAWGTVHELAKALSGELTPSPRNTVPRSHVNNRHDVITGPIPIDSGTSTTDQFWACNHCTFHNRPDSTECEMCSLPQHG